MALLQSFVTAAEGPIEALLIDSRQLVRAGMGRLLADMAQVEVGASVADFDAAIRWARTHVPQLVLVSLPGDGVEVLDGVRKMRRQFADIRLLIVTDESDLLVQERLLQSGVTGMLEADCSVAELYTAIDTVIRGDRYISDALAQKLAERRVPGRVNTPFDQLTHRELQILLLVAAGHSTATMARELCLTRKTVNSYRNRLLEKLQADTDVELMHLAMRHGLVSTPL